MNPAELTTMARALVAEGKGILAADESYGTIDKRFKSINIPNTEENRRSYRELLFATPGIEQFISGVILFDETIRQCASDGTPFPTALSKRGIIPGIKVDLGAKEMPLFPGEKITEGLDGLTQRLVEYRQMGARFAKWRAVIDIGSGIPTATCLVSNAEALARYAAICQSTDIVPIVEPEVLMDGDHDIERCAQVTVDTLRTVFNYLAAHRVFFEGMLLKPNMVIPGKKASQKASPREVAMATVSAFRRVVPAAVPGIVFLSGGQGPIEAAENLNAMNSMGPHPWQLSFSYGRALQEEALKAWQGKPGNVPAARRAFQHRAKCDSAARYGRYTGEMEAEARATT